jgi:hypothetical protein
MKKNHNVHKRSLKFFLEGVKDAGSRAKRAEQKHWILKIII